MDHLLSKERCTYIGVRLSSDLKQDLRQPSGTEVLYDWFVFYKLGTRTRVRMLTFYLSN